VDVTQRGEYCECPHCDLEFCVVMNRPTVEMWGEIRKQEACRQKVGHQTLQSAWDTWIEIKDRPIHNGSEMTVYLCELCGLYHLGHKPAETVPRRHKLVWTMGEVEEELQFANAEHP